MSLSARKRAYDIDGRNKQPHRLHRYLHASAKGISAKGRGQLSSVSLNSHSVHLRSQFSGLAVWAMHSLRQLLSDEELEEKGWKE